ncbi:MAG: hypothetical protein KAQ83_01875, partial [Nanoarchaeota archaeon]|nr:hypothetical protein [Nanoarchaeota archaeon]
MGYKPLILGFLVLILLISTAEANTFINEKITLDTSGFALVEGETNIDVLSEIKPEDNIINGYTDELTKKDGPWFFSYSTDEIMKAYMIKVYLPSGSDIHNINTDSKVFMSVDNNKHLLTFSGQNESFDIEIEYSYQRTRSPIKSYGTIIAYVGFFILLSLLIFFTLLLVKYIAKKNIQNNKILNQEKLKTVRLTLNENQLKIIDALIEKKGEASQTQLKYLTSIPKSSLSRNLEIMAQKSIISKYYNGTS